MVLTVVVVVIATGATVVGPAPLNAAKLLAIFYSLS
jgi:hypothetical protein